MDSKSRTHSSAILVQVCAESPPDLEKNQKVRNRKFYGIRLQFKNSNKAYMILLLCKAISLVDNFRILEF